MIHLLRGEEKAPRFFWVLFLFCTAIVIYDLKTQRAAANNATCYPDLSDPQLELVESGKEYNDYAGTTYVNYQFRVVNWKQFPSELFAAAPDLPPCGRNPNASRTWASTYDSESGAYLYGSCGAMEDFKGLYARVPVKKGDNPPKGVFLTLEDRKCGITYKSNTVKLPKGAIAAGLEDGKEAVKKAMDPPHQANAPTKPITRENNNSTPAGDMARQVLKLRNGNLVEGTVVRENDQEVTIVVPQAGEVSFARAEIASIEALQIPQGTPANTEEAKQRLQSTVQRITQTLSQGGDRSGILKPAEEALIAKSYEAALSAFDQIESRKGTLEVDIMGSPVKSIVVQEALSALEKEVQAKPNDTALHFYLGRFYRFIGIMTPIITSYETGTSTTVGDAEREQYLAKAVEQLQNVRRLEPSRHEAAYYLAKTYSLLSRFDEALVSVQEAVKLAPGRIDYQDYQAGLYLTTGRFKEAVAAYETLLKQPIAGRDEVEFALGKIRLLNQLAGSETKEKKSEIPDQFEGTAVMKFLDVQIDEKSFAGRKPEEFAALRSQMTEGLANEEWQLSIQQDGHILQAMDVQGMYSGFTSGNAFVLGSQQSTEWEGCQVTQRQIITGQLESDGMLRITNGLRGLADHPEKCPKALGNADTIWQGTLRK